MSKLTQWLDHRMEVVGVESWTDLSEQSGVSLTGLQGARTKETLDVLSRSERRHLAVVLRVSLGRLEKLDNGQIDWIEDSFVYDAITRGRPRPAQENDPDHWTPITIQPEDRGTPLVGRIRSDGKADPDEEWNEEFGRFVPRRFGKGHDIYALEMQGEGTSIIFRNIAPWEFREGQAAVYCWNGWEAEGWFGNVVMQPSKASVITGDGQRHDLDLVDIVRIGKVIRRWPEVGDACAVG